MTEVVKIENTNAVGSATVIEEGRAVAQVKAAILMAKTHPRNETSAYGRIMEACKRKSFAESATFAFPRGGTLVTGPSIRMAETLARYWGNIDYGIQVISQDQLKGTSEVMAYAWDIETNTRQTRIFSISHKRKARGKMETISDPRDLYEYEANLGARRLRACILGLIPADIVEEAERACDETLQGNTEEPISERARKMVARFGEVGVTQSELEEYLGHSLDGLIPVRLVELGKIYNSIKSGIATPDKFFKRPDKSEQEAEKLTQQLQAKKGDNDNDK